jgi:hypothetical protein
MHRQDRVTPVVTGQPVTAGPVSRLEADAIGVGQDVVIGMASSAPAATAGLTLAALAAATAYGAGIVLLITAVPMLVIANAYRRLNLLLARFAWQSPLFRLTREATGSHRSSTAVST